MYKINKINVLTNLFKRGNLLMMAAASSGSSVATQSLYNSSGINGSYSSRYHNFKRLAGACASIFIKNIGIGYCRFI